MNVRELVAELNKYHPETPVLAVFISNIAYPITQINLIRIYEKPDTDHLGNEIHHFAYDNGKPKETIPAVILA